MCLPLAILASIILGTYSNIVPELELLIWLQVPVYLLHQFEEHAWPGGFGRFVNKIVFKQESGGPLDERSLFWINIPIVWIGFPIFAALSTISIGLGIWIIYLSLINGIFHILVGLRLRRYNPGLILSLLGNVPLSIYTLVRLPDLEPISSTSHIIGIAIALAVQVGLVAFVIKKSKNKYDKVSKINIL
jgi:hypothetical protein